MLLVWLNKKLFYLNFRAERKRNKNLSAKILNRKNSLTIMNIVNSQKVNKRTIGKNNF